MPIGAREVTHARPAPARVRRIRDRLRLLYGIPSAPPHGRGLDELILTVLSQSTNDRNRDVAFLALRRRFGSWAAVRDAPVEEVELAIRPGGISRVKSQRIQAILRELTERIPPRPGAASPICSAAGTADDDLEPVWLAGATVEEGRDFLCSLPGVGRKTAACVLLFAYGKRDVPVDTHVSRVGARLGLFRDKAPFEEMHDDLLAMTPRGQELELHVNLLRHGRRTCHARRPACAECALLPMCPTGYYLRHPD
jgi:endonuclease-3